MGASSYIGKAENAPLGFIDSFVRHSMAQPQRGASMPCIVMRTRVTTGQTICIGERRKKILTAPVFFHIVIHVVQDIKEFNMCYNSVVLTRQPPARCYLEL
jgi:hypothetical protein